MSGTFLDNFSEIATDTLLSSFFVRFGLHFGMLFGVQVAKNGYKKHSENIPAKNHAGLPGRKQELRDTPLSSLKRTIPGSQDWQPSQGIRDTPLVPGGTVADYSILSHSTPLKRCVDCTCYWHVFLEETVSGLQLCNHCI